MKPLTDRQRDQLEAERIAAERLAAANGTPRALFLGEQALEARYLTPVWGESDDFGLVVVDSIPFDCEKA